jgi:WD40 repeat protein
MDMSQGQILNSFSVTNSYYSNIAFAPNGVFLVSATGDGTIHIWGIPAVK